MSDVKAIGALVKYNMVDVDDEILDQFFGSLDTTGWQIEEMLEEWSKKFEDIILFPVDEYMSQFTLISKDVPLLKTFNVNNSTFQCIFIVEDSKLRLDNIRNAEELSGEGKIITSFNLKFTDYNTKFTRETTQEFFKLEPSQIILNSVRLVVDNNDRTLEMKLTGKAAEIAAKRKKAT